jgi:hypothetical protein
MNIVLEMGLASTAMGLILNLGVLFAKPIARESGDCQSSKQGFSTAHAALRYAA